VFNCLYKLQYLEKYLNTVVDVFATVLLVAGTASDFRATRPQKLSI